MRFFKFNFFLVAFVFIYTINTLGQCSINFTTVPTIGEGCDVLGVQFTSTISGTTIGTPSWNFGDGSPIFNGKNPLHNYTTGSKDTTYTVTLSVTCVDGSTISKNGTIKVFAKPTATFDVVNNQICTFSDTLKVINVSNKINNLQYKWDFGDNETSTLQYPKHVFTVSGNYIVTLEVTNANGCKNRTQKSIVAKPAPNPQFMLDKFIGCEPLTVVATNTTENDTSFLNTNFEWRSSNGNILSNIINPSFYFATSGVKEIELIVTNSLGCTFSTSANILVKESPKIINTNIPNSPICYNSPLQLNVVTSPQNATIIWRETSNTLINDTLNKSTTLTFKDGGLQTLTASLKFNGCIIDTSFNLTVFPKPNLELFYSPTELCEENDINLTASPTDLQSYIFKNNGININSNKFEATASSAKLINLITLNAIDNSGCAVNTELKIEAKQKPKIQIVTNAVNDSLCINESINITVLPTGLTKYNFIIDGISVKNDTSNSYTSPPVSSPISVNIIAEKLGCYDTNTLKTIYTKLPIAPPNLNCIESTFSTITYSFNQIIGASNYEISLDSGLTYTTLSKITNQYIATGLTPNTNYSAMVRITVPSQNPCDSLIISAPITCKTIPCEKLDFHISPTISRLCESGDVRINLDSIISPSGTYNIYWNGVKSQDKFFELKKLGYDQSPYTIIVNLEDTTRSAECKMISKTSKIFVDEQPNESDFYFSYEVNSDCNPTKNIKLGIVSPNPTYKYTFIKNDTIGNSTTYIPPTSVLLNYEQPDSLVFLKIESPNFGCKTFIKKEITAQNPDDPIKIVSIDSLINTQFDSISCLTTTNFWKYNLHSTINSSSNLNILKYFPELDNYKLTRISIHNENDKKDSIVYSNSKYYVIDSVLKFKKDLNFSKVVSKYTFYDSITYYNANSCPIAYSKGNNVTIETPEDCNSIDYKYCTNRSSTISINDVVDLSCLKPLGSGKFYFSKKPEGYTLIDSITVKRNLDTNSTILYIKNKVYKCYQSSVPVCSFTCDSVIYIPNTITPNGDGKNDNWEIKHAPENISIRIYNRWEQLVFSSDEYKNNFEGVSNDGQLLTDGVYFYEIKLNGESHLLDPIRNSGKEAKSFEEILNKDYSINSYECNPHKYDLMKGKLLIQR